MATQVTVSGIQDVDPADIPESKAAKFAKENAPKKSKKKASK